MQPKSSTFLAASYSRYSSDNQRDTSIDDQQRLTDGRAAAEGWPLVGRFVDCEISASTPISLREGGKAMLAAAARGEFQVLLVEALDRCWRDIVDQERTIRRLEHLGILIVGVGDGYDSRHEGRELARGVRGILNEQYLRDLAKKTHRGLVGQVFRGGHAGGLSYGYRSIDTGTVHLLEVDEGQAAWVRWIFERCAEGWTFRAIAAELNRLGVATGRGGTWAVSALYGCPNKGSGILNNELYIGRYVWNRSQWSKDPDTGKRRRSERPRDEWIVEAREDLRIVSAELWQACRARIDTGRLEGGSRGKGAKPRTLFSGILKCGKCGGAVTAVSYVTYGCSMHKERGDAVCTGVRMPRKDLERRLLTVIREDLLAPAAIARFHARVAELMKERSQSATRDGQTIKAELAAVQSEIRRLVDAVVAVGHSDALAARLRETEARRDALLARQGEKTASPAALDGMMARYRKHLMAIEADLQAEPDRARQALRDYFGEIVLEDNGAEVWAVFGANPSRLLMKAAGDSGSGCGGTLWFPESQRIRLR